ncbi:hypothetical protein A1O3_06975 [Capronia epimyces CBS 606.96]|uniref:Cytochrome P450 oxidoreductase n=1 Tax=Capronia epimyces CBS 606.96 TaxID=1182542 RepID=W9XUK4_9EURO|nr:uncharacterized protein A1O3_06975 [Capronia epimyces CBS 606.96]EXJ80691.1 hypothetical protein A1O3_06975 [Capronia epimyces CBS 606.96]
MGFSTDLDVLDLLHATVRSYKGVGLLLLALVILTLLIEAYRTDLPRIPGIPQVPCALPFVGHLHRLGGRIGQNDSTVFTQWAKDLKSSVFQCLLGSQRTVVVSDWPTIRELWLRQSNALIDRPHQPGFVDKLGIDLTGSCMTDQIRKCRAAGMRALAKVGDAPLVMTGQRPWESSSMLTGVQQPAWPKYYHLIEPSSAQFISSLHQRSDNGKTPIDTYAFLRHIVFDLVLSLTYGARFGKVDDDFTLGLIKSINAISSFRSSTKKYRFFVPLLRLLPDPTSQIVAAERARARYRDILYNQYKDRIARGETVDCIVTSLTEDKLTEEEIHGTCLGLLQAAPDTVASGLYQAIAWLSSPEGRPTQERALTAILDAYGGDRTKAWKNAFREEKVPLISSINKETLRFFTVTPYATPRRTTEDVTLPNGVVLPKGITLVMNAQEANHEEAHYGADAWTYKPDRFITNEAGGGLPHLTFGAGSRICPAVAISNRIICALLTRLVLAFEMDGSEDEARRPNVDALDFSNVYDSLVAHPRFYDCRFKARDPDWLENELADELAASAD